MKKFFFLLSLVCCVSIYGENWKNYWIESSLMFKENKFDEAEILINKSIALIEGESLELPYIYIERARVKAALNKNIEALDDLNKALNSKELSLSDKSSALMLKFIVCNILGILKDAQNSWEEYKSINIMPEYDETDEYLLIRNMPNCSCYRKLIAGYCFEMGICENLSDFKMLDENSCVIKKNKKISECEGCNKNHLSPIREGNRNKPAEDDCNGWCDYMAIAGNTWCGKSFKTHKCQAACCMAVEYIKKKLCYWCCTDGEFYRNCIKPFANILDYIKEPCDPMWD